MKIRIIKFSNRNGSKEGVFFTEDLEADAQDFVEFGCELDSDDVVECRLPDNFPLEYTLWRA